MVQINLTWLEPSKQLKPRSASLVYFLLQFQVWFADIFHSSKFALNIAAKSSFQIADFFSLCPGGIFSGILYLRFSIRASLWIFWGQKLCKISCIFFCCNRRSKSIEKNRNKFQSKLKLGVPPKSRFSAQKPGAWNGSVSKSDKTPPPG